MKSDHENPARDGPVSGLQTVRDLFEGWPENQSGITEGFKGSKAKNAYPRINRGELPICIFHGEELHSGERLGKCTFPHGRAEFVIADKNSEGQITSYSPVISMLAKVPKADPDDAYFLISLSGNLKATLHKKMAHIKINTTPSSPQNRLIHCKYPKLQEAPTPILHIVFPSFGYSNQSAPYKQKDGRVTFLSPRPPKGKTLVLDFALHLLPVHDFYNYGESRVLAVVSDYRRYVLVAYTYFADLQEEEPGGLKDELLRGIQQGGAKSAYQDVFAEPDKNIWGAFTRCNDETTGPLIIVEVNNFRELVNEAFS